MKNVISIAACVIALAAPASVAAQTGADAPKTAEQVKKDVATTTAIKQKVDEAQNNPRFVRTLTNVQVELTLTDQLGSNPAEKKTVSMIATTGTLGKVRTVGTIRPQGDAPYPVMLNVDARPFVSVEGTVQLEVTLEYYPMKGGGEEKEGAKQRPSGINQSQTVVLQSGKPLIISQAADPISDRKVIVEVKATILK
jgi:hypothetical protein